MCVFVFFFKHKTAYEMRISDWSSDVCSSDLLRADLGMALGTAGWVMGVFALIGVVGGIPAGAAVSRFGDRRLIVLGLALIALGSAAGALAGTVSMMLAARVVEGAGLDRKSTRLNYSH